MTNVNDRDATRPVHSDTAGMAPAWAAFLTPTDWAWFVAAVTSDLDARGLGHSIDVDGGSVRVDRDGSPISRPLPSGIPNVLGLSNLAQICRTRPREVWQQTIKEHFDVAFNGTDARDADELAKTWENAKRALKLRLYVSEHTGDVPVVTWPVANELVAMLAFDLPETVISVKREDRAHWGVPDAEVFATALANVRAEGLLTQSVADIGENTTLRVLEGGSSFFAATHALFLDEYLTDPAPHGAIVAVPHRHIVVFHPLVDQRASHAVRTMVLAAQRMFTEGPGSISTDLYWWRPRPGKLGELLQLPCEVDGDAINFKPPPEFAALLKALPPYGESRSIGS